MSMPSFSSPSRRTAESGNVLFLILVAVVLFAALTYAVTQSRWGNNEESVEKNLISKAQITQYPADISTSIVRMMLNHDVTIDQLDFNPPTAFDIPNTAYVDPHGKRIRAVFHADGGGITWQQAPAVVMDDGQPGQWYYNANFSIPNIGNTSVMDASGNDLIAFLPGVRQDVCEKIDESVGLAAHALPVMKIDMAAMKVTQHAVAGVVIPPFPVSPGTPLVPVTGASVAGQPFACLSNGASPPVFVYYHVLLER